MIIEIDGITEDLQLLVMNDPELYYHLVELIRKRRRLYTNWRESYKVVEVWCASNDVPVSAVSPWRLDELVMDATPAPHDKYITHESGVCLNIISEIETGIKHGYCLITFADQVGIALCKGIVCNDCRNEMEKKYVEWRDNVRDNKAIVSSAQEHEEENSESANGNIGENTDELRTDRESSDIGECPEGLCGGE